MRTIPNKRDIKLDKFNISRNRYRELMYFCLQYHEKIVALKHLKAAPDNMKQLNKQKELERDILAIEQAAITADEFLCDYILKSVTKNIPFELLCVPCCRSQFYKKRRIFFQLLNSKDACSYSENAE